MENHTYQFAKRNFATADIKGGASFVMRIAQKLASPIAKLPLFRSSRGYGSHRKSYYLQEF